MGESIDCCRNTKVTEKGLLQRNRRQIIKVWEGTEEGKIDRQTAKTVNKRGTVTISGSSKQRRSNEAENPEDDTRPARERGRTSSLTEEMQFLGFPARGRERRLVSSNANIGTGERGSSDKVFRSQRGITVNKPHRIYL
ncbi:hypothetical protein PR048_003245 [Dryococelus australis]|uniref:Uncharacterized protein n=1 Tax=Dryococelus australis TaxID=614101 RepID=A0ABQ9IMF7_9NEOP|nr:hypothetical protein PR048_003245 [Dryococelus australis]